MTPIALPADRDKLVTAPAVELTGRMLILGVGADGLLRRPAKNWTKSLAFEIISSDDNPRLAHETP